MSDDAIQEMDQKLRQILRDMYDIGDTEAQTLLKVAIQCAKTDGVQGALLTGLGSAVIGGTVTLGTTAIPAWVAGVLAGFVGTTLTCTISRFAPSLGIQRFLETTGHSQEEMKQQVHRMLSVIVDPSTGHNSGRRS